ncbi:tape measure protein [Cytobacillus kochii]|uniref:tape measure protein n=1 Tax=Cytobacillus kochii TaxID=859143 RepID=UPI00203F6A1F|nr:tape measure protein [Cytobacillus kochii]MCM3324236.1 tape measure protein [Cytobacillus kochii]MCM3346695.1 tape measure protein [Cytobacillus kochii]
MADGSIRIEIEVDGRQVTVASNALDRLEDSAIRSGRGMTVVENSMDSISDSSTQASSSVRGAGSAIEGLGESGSRASRDLRGVEGSVDGLADSSTSAASSVRGVSDSLDGMASQAQEASQEVSNVGEETGRASFGIKELATSLGLVAIGTAVFNELKNSVDAAIARFDTLNAFPKVLQALGVSAEDSEKAMNRLSEGIDGLPTTLNDIAGSAQRMYTSFNDMDKSTESAIALNNALLGSGSSAEEAKRGTDQYIKALQTGTMNMDTWNTLSETMDVGLIKIAEGFEFAGKSAKDDLYNALQDGVITLDQFNEKLIEVGTGTGIMAKLAKENSLGIATSLGNLRNAAAKGIADIIKSFDKLSQEVTGKDIAQNIDSLKAIVNQSFKVIGSVIESTTPIFKAFGSAVDATLPVVKALSPVLISLSAAFAAQMIINKVIIAVKASNTAMLTAAASQQALTLATRAQVVAQIASTNATRADTLATMANTGAIGLGSLAIGVLSGKIKLATAAKIAFAAATKLVMGPIGWITLAIGALVGGTIALVKWFNKASEEEKKLADETNKLAEETGNLNDEINSNSEAHSNNIGDIEATSKANEGLAQKIKDLSEKEKKSAEDKALLNSYIEQLNGSIQGLSLSYNEEADALNMSSEQLKGRIELLREEEKLTESQARLVELSKDRNKAEEKLEEINEKRAEWNKLLEEGGKKGEEAKEAIHNLDEKEAGLTETLELLKIQQQETEEQIVTSNNAITEAVQNGVLSQEEAYARLSGSARAAVENMKSTWEDYKEQATNMFDTLSEKSELSVSEMTSNLQENQRIISEWAENIATLAERGVDEGLLNTLREAGPESAGHVNALVNASDEELKNLSEAFQKGGDTATDALSKSLGIEESGVMEAVGHLVTGMEQSLAEEIQSADFKSLGKAMPEGTAGGIEEGSPQAQNASKNMAKDTANAFKQEAGINSPSKVFKGFGSNITEGLVLGINEGSNAVLQSVQNMFKGILESSEKNFRQISKGHDNSVKIIEKSLKKLPLVTQQAMKNMLARLRAGSNDQTKTMRLLAKDLVTPFNGTRGQFNSVGRNAMAGLNQGLLAGRGAVMSTARSIANSVASTMKNALRIHSPSRLMRDDVGRWIPEGIAVGIRENAKSVYKELDTLSNGMILTSTAEQALGTSRMAHSGMGNQLVDAIRGFQIPTQNEGNQGEPNSKQPAVISLYVGSKEVAREIVDDITNLQNRSNNRKRRRPR